MILDHTAAVWIEQSEWLPGTAWSFCGTAMRLAGRVAFPLFAFMIAEGAVHTKNWKKYAFRLLILAILSEIPFNLAAGGAFFYPEDQNTVFTLLLGLLAIEAGNMLCGWLSHGEKFLSGYERYIRAAAGMIFALAAYLLRTDYDFLGVMLIVFMYLLRSESRLRTAVCITILICMYMNFYAVTACVAIFLINRYNGEKGSGDGKFFYVFYPLHLLIIWGVKIITGL